MRHPPPGPVSDFSVRERNKIMSTDPSLIWTGASLCLNNGSKSECRVAKFHFQIGNEATVGMLPNML